jgi:hypothetical protein
MALEIEGFRLTRPDVGIAGSVVIALRASVRRHRRAQGGSPMLRSIRPVLVLAEARARRRVCGSAQSKIRPISSLA